LPFSTIRNDINITIDNHEIQPLPR
jgi:hypothetical protein